MVPAEDLKVHIGSKQRVGIAYYHLAFNKKPTVDRRNSNGCTDSMKLVHCLNLGALQGPQMTVLNKFLLPILS